jgi:hypothetical protein
MTYNEFIEITGLDSEMYPAEFYHSNIEPQYMRFENLSKQAFCRIYVARLAENALYALGEEMKKGFESTHDMNRFTEKAERKVAEINKLVMSVK